MTKIIALFNNKGGVSKTTTTYHLGWKLAQKGHKTLIVDTDPQCNLTGLCLNFDKHDKLGRLYRGHSTNIKQSLSPVLEGGVSPLKPADCYCFEDNTNLYLLPGHIDFSEYDATYNIAENMTGALSIFKNVPGAFRNLLLQTAERYGFEYILIDMSPSISATNANILMQSDFFILPCAPDYFCYMAIESLNKVFPKWNKTYNNLRNSELLVDAEYPLQDKSPKFIGTIQQRYRPRNGSPAKAFSEWIDEIDNLVSDKLIPTLQVCNMLVEHDSTLYDKGYNLINIADFNSLIAQSQTHNTPVFLLTQEQVQKTGSVWENMKKSRDQFNDTFEKLAESIICISNT